MFIWNIPSMQRIKLVGLDNLNLKTGYFDTRRSHLTVQIFMINVSMLPLPPTLKMTLLILRLH